LILQTAAIIYNLLAVNQLLVNCSLQLSHWFWNFSHCKK